ncbi:MAG TPA: sugar ABC transporter permease [Candidatus Limnocylindrales bacterium]
MSATSATGARPRVGFRVPTKWVTISLFLLPALVLYLLFVLVPVVQAAHYSLYKWNGLQPLDNFVGLRNYATALGSDTFRTAVSNNFLIIALSLAIQIPFSLSLAVLLNRRFRGRTLFRVIFFLPYVLSEAITGVVFSLLLRPGALIDSGLSGVGLGGVIQDWLGDPGFVMITLFIIISWKYFGFHMILLLAGLQGIPREIEEAALIDGAGRWQAFRHITLPLLGPTLRVSVFLSMIGALQLFDMIWVMTRGGPLGASNTMAIAMFKAGFQNQQMGYGSALAVILFLFALVLALAYQRFVLQRDVEGAVTAFNG